MNRTLLVLLTACGPRRTDDGPTPTWTCDGDASCDPGLICDESQTCVPGDRDNSFDAATPIRFNEEATGIIEPDGDVDHFRFATTEDGVWVNITTTHPRTSGLNTVVHLYSEDGRERAWADDYDIYRVVSTDSNLVAWLPRAGVWFIAVEDASTFYTPDTPASGPDFEYTLSLTEFSAVTSERGDPPVLDLTTGTTVSRRGVRIERAGDIDEIELRAPFDGRLLQITAGTGVLRSDLTVSATLERDGITLMQQPDLKAGTYGMILSSQEGPYRLLITDRDGEGGDDAWTVVYARTYDEGASVSFWGTSSYLPEAEPNDTTEQATPLDLLPQTTTSGLDYDAAYFEGTLGAADDVDAFTFPARAGDLLTLRCYADRFGSIADLTLDLLGPQDVDPVESVDAYTPWSAPQLYNHEADRTGDWRVAIRSEDGAHGVAAWWRCQVIVTDWIVDEP